MEGRDDDCSKCHPSRLRNLFRAGVRTGSREIQAETSDSMRAPIPDVPKGMGDCEVRLSLSLLKVLPVKVRQPVLERQDGPVVRSVLLLESLHETWLQEEGKRLHHCKSSCGLSMKLNLLRLQQDVIVTTKSGLSASAISR